MQSAESLLEWLAEKDFLDGRYEEGGLPVVAGLRFLIKEGA